MLYLSILYCVCMSVHVKLCTNALVYASRLFCLEGSTIWATTLNILKVRSGEYNAKWLPPHLEDFFLSERR